MRGVAVLLLAIGCIHEFAWQLLPAGLGLQGNFRNVTQWALFCALFLVVHVLARNRFMSAVCVALTVMSSTTAACSLWWFFARFEWVPGREQCSKAMSFPLLMLSASAALLVFWCWREPTRERQG